MGKSVETEKLRLAGARKVTASHLGCISSSACAQRALDTALNIPFGSLIADSIFRVCKVELG